MSEVIQSLWVGGELSTVELLCLHSFLRHGHEFALFSYGEISNLPAGVKACDAREILPETAVFQYRDFPSYAGFSNFFRYRLLLERGGWWVDTDVVCLKPLHFPEEHIFAAEPCPGETVPATAVIKAAAGSRCMAYAWEACSRKDPAAIKWGETGPRLLREAIEHCTMTQAIQPAVTFCPWGAHEWRNVLTPGRSIAELARSSTLHLWNEMWRRAGCDKNADYDPACVFEELKRAFL